MFRLNKKKLGIVGIGLSCILLLAVIIPVIRPPVLNVLKLPLGFLQFVSDEVNGLIFFHRNMVQNEILKKEIGILRQKLIEFDDVVLENGRLNALFDFKQKTSYKVIAARVIGSSADDWSSVVIIDKGRSQGIKSGYVTVGYKGLIGRVIEAGSGTSKVMLINDPNLSVSAVVQRSRQEGLVSGSLSGSLVMRYLPLESDIGISDTVITSGLSQVYPKGIPIGKVVSVGYEFSGLSRYALLKPFVELSHLEEVLVIIP